MPDWNVLSLFSGIGGLELGLERAGMTVVGQVEKDPYCLRVLAKHWPEVPRYDDVTTAVDWWRAKPRPAIRLVAGGFPCQPVSEAGRKLAQADERWLWPEMWAIIRDLRPEYAIMENVPGLLRRGMGDVLADLAAGGYDAEWDCVPAAAVGAPHLRYRVFIVARLVESSGGVSDTERGDLRVEWERDGQQHGESWPSEPRRDGASRAMADAAGVRRDPRTRVGDTCNPAIGREGEYRSSDSGTAFVADTEGDGWRTRRARRSAGDGPDRPSVTPTGLADTGRTGLERRRIFRPTRYRDWWTTEPDVGRVANGVPARVDRLRGLGNAVVPQVAEHVGRLVMEYAS